MRVPVKCVRCSNFPCVCKTKPAPAHVIPPGVPIPKGTDYKRVGAGGKMVTTEKVFANPPRRPPGELAKRPPAALVKLPPASLYGVQKDPPAAPPDATPVLPGSPSPGLGPPIGYPVGAPAVDPARSFRQAMPTVPDLVIPPAADTLPDTERPESESMTLESLSEFMQAHRLALRIVPMPAGDWQCSLWTADNEYATMAHADTPGPAFLIALETFCKAKGLP